MDESSYLCKTTRNDLATRRGTEKRALFLLRVINNFWRVSLLLINRAVKRDLETLRIKPVKFNRLRMNRREMKTTGAYK